jgi:predicted membrane-bound dolichyl-phosphate-mannose-protein mannosyltransferase
MLGHHLPADATYADSPPGSDPNSEHPPLGKLMIAGTMKLFGDNPWGWRTSAVVLGIVALLALYALVRAAGGSRWTAVAATAVMSTDNLFLVHGRIGTLDIGTLAFMLVAAALYVSRRPLLAGVALGVGATIKEVAAYALLVLALVEAGRWLRERRAGSRPSWIVELRDVAARRFLVLVAAAAASYFALLGLLDRVTRPYDPGRHLFYTNPFSHTWHILRYGVDLRSHGDSGISSRPWLWFLNEKQINYFTVTVTHSVNGHTVSTENTIAFLGAINPFIIFLAIPALVLAVSGVVRSRTELDLVAFAWFLGTYLPLLGQSVFGSRTSYLYYMLLVLPGIYVALVRLFARTRLPAAAAVGWAVALAVGLVQLYPVRTWTGL